MAKKAPAKKPHQSKTQKRDAHGHFIKSTASKTTKPSVKMHQSKTQKRDYHGRFSHKVQAAQTQTISSPKPITPEPIGREVTIAGSSPDGRRSFFAKFTQIKFKIPSAKLRTTQLAILALALLAVSSAGAGYYFYSQNQKLTSDPNKIARENAKELVAKVGQLIELPQGEEPVVATVSDKDKLKNQSFFAKAENGDNVIIYSQSRKAILYRASVNRVIEVATLNINTGDQGQVSGEKVPAQSSPSPQEEPQSRSQTQPSPSPKSSP